MPNFILGDEDIDPATGKVRGNEEDEAAAQAALAAEEAEKAEAAKVAAAAGEEGETGTVGDNAPDAGTEEEGETTETEAGDPVVELDGEQYTLAQLREMQDALKNKNQWQTSNTQKAQEVAEKRRLVDEVLEQINNNPSLIQRGQAASPQANAPDPLTQATEELEAIYGKRPEDPFSPEARTWEREKDVAIRKVARIEAVEEAQATASQTTVVAHNRQVATEAYETFSKTLSDDEYVELEKWVAGNIRPDEQGRYSKQGFDVAFKILHGDKQVRADKLEQTRKIGKALEAGARAEGDGGLRVIHPKLTEADKEDNAFVTAVKERMQR